MKLTELLLEYDRDITSKKFSDKLELASQSDTKSSVDKVLTSLEDMDPTKNKQYVQWLVKQYIKKLFRLEDYPRVKQVLVDFDKLKPRLPERDINRFTFHELEAQIDKVLNPELGDVKPKEGNFDVPKNAEVLYNGPLGLLIIPKTEEAACELGKGTKWCTASKENNMFSHYHKEGKLYIWRDRDGSKYQFHFESSQFMDAQDRDISHEKLMQFRNEHPVLKKLFKLGEETISKHARPAYKYARDVIKGRFPEAEEIISKHVDSALSYAAHIIKGRFPEGEKEIAKFPSSAIGYAKDVIKGRFLASEDEIAKSADYALEYAVHIIKDRFPEGEKEIAKYPVYAYQYARDVIKGRFPEGENAIVNSSHDDYHIKKYISLLKSLNDVKGLQEFKEKFKLE